MKVTLKIVKEISIVGNLNFVVMEFIESILIIIIIKLIFKLHKSLFEIIDIFGYLSVYF